MNRKDEKEYYAYLEKIIREQKRNSLFFHSDNSSREMDIMMLMEHIQRKNPSLAEQIVNNFIDTTGMENASKQDVLKFMGQTEKGAIVKWKNEQGQEVYLINNGENFFSNSKRILVIGNHIGKDDMELLKKSVLGTVLKKDIRHVYEKIARDEAKKTQGKTSSVLDFIEKHRERKLDNSASDFERNFKEIVKKQGDGCLPLQTASTIISFMGGVERKQLNESLFSRGVKDTASLERLLSKWKDEALHPKKNVEKTMAKKTVTIEYGR